MDRSRRARLSVTAAVVVGLLAGPGTVSASAAPPASETPELVVVLDSSGSMAETDAGNGQTRMDAAKQAVTELATSTPSTTRVGLRTYGDGVDSQAPGSCEDTTLRVPVGPVDRDALTTQVDALQPRGDTPIGTALLAAADDFTGTGPQSVVLVSDGEPTCDPDPCPVAAQLADQGIDLRIDVIGLLVDAAARDILQCIADAGGGQYVDAADATELTAALDTSATRSFRTYVPEGTPIQGTPTSEGAPALSEGQFLDAIPAGGTLHYTMDLAEGETLRLGATIVRADGSRRGTDGFVTVETFNAAGERCYWELSVGGAEQGSAPRVGGLLHGPGSGTLYADDCTEGTFGVEVEWSNAGSDDGTLPMELVVDLEPPQTGVAEDATAPDRETVYPEPTRAAGTAVAVSGGTSFNDAALLEPGLHSDTLRRGETVYYRVPLDWGQQLAFRADFPELAADDPLLEVLDATTFVNLALFSPYRAVATPLGDNAVRQDTLSQDGGLLSVVTHPVDRDNRLESVYGELRHMSQPGEVVLQVSMADSSTTEDEQAVALPFELSVEVRGEVEAGPEYVGDAATSGPAPTGPTEPTGPNTTDGDDTQETPTPATSAGAAPTAGADGPGPVVVSLAVVAALLVLALGGLVAYGVRTTRRGRAGTS